MAEPVFDPRLLSLRAAGARWLQDRRDGDARQFANGAAVIVEQLDALGAEVERLRADVDRARDELATARQFRQAEADFQQVMERAEQAEAERDRLAAAVQRAAEHARHWTGWGSGDYAQAGYQILADLGQPAAAAPDDEQDGAYR